ncbi:N-acetylmuramic acid 6-phosphate etherase [Lapidilactobacillus concavus DSM 17758]|uniref:N-acetylmuramic acid 6-phosphate etherase n=1 Tax=Lapidilactobacillus concavus DSM 17758 TaxID=1423735 RepID=A0A0R1W9E9_9LACO|nr:N-acetylmuramic acid 6-phosphate etherase [Lapidilactobacillus concavus]KRM12443.1 N-acetylmuramic acid 6-phosphate etherase [Lapidilactobacillus concavus DSM 17758]GEL13276.1 N-acetylmuramic acid 6-phosphate etherase [Lapidilactobacillus concavus]
MIKRTTEMRNPETTHIDEMSTQQILTTINREDQQVPRAISEPALLAELAKIVDAVVNGFKQGGRLFYIGAGTSGRLGVLDAAECVPTFGTDPEMVQGLIAGGDRAMTEAVEGAEDSVEGGRADLVARNLSQHDFVLGIAASGTTPYVIGGLDYAREVGAGTGALSCNHQALISEHAEFAIEAVVGPEVVTGSTRMKSGTAEKLILNMISTSTMIKLGKVYGNLMVDVKPTNLKLIDRSKRIIQDATGVDRATAEKYFELSQQQPKTAIVMINAEVDYETAVAALAKNNGFIAAALKDLR